MKTGYNKRREVMRIAHKMYKKRFYTSVLPWKCCMQEAWQKVKQAGEPREVIESDIDNLDFAMF